MRLRPAFKQRLKGVARLLCALLFFLAGIYHFRRPDIFDHAMPDWLPAHYPLIYFTGVCELLGGIGLLVPIVKLRRVTSICLAVFLVMVFPVNINMALNPKLFPQIDPMVLWLRLVLQPIFIALVLWSASPAVSADSGSETTI